MVAGRVGRGKHGGWRLEHAQEEGAGGLACAFSTSETICERVVSRPTRRAWTSSTLPPLTVPPMTALPRRLATGTDSPARASTTAE